MQAAAFDGFQLAHLRGARGGVTVQVYRNIDGFDQFADQVCCDRGDQQAGHVLDRDTVAAHLHHLFRHGHELFDAVYRAGGVTDGSLGMLAGLLHRSDRGFEVAQVVQCIEDPKHIDAVVGGLAHESAYHVIGVVAITQQVLAAQQHLQARVGQCGAQLAQAFPGIFLQVTQTGIEGGSTPHLKRPVADIVQLFAGGQHVVGAHACGDQRLVRIAQNDICDLNLGHTESAFSVNQ